MELIRQKKATEIMGLVTAPRKIFKYYPIIRNFKKSLGAVGRRYVIESKDVVFPQYNQE